MTLTARPAAATAPKPRRNRLQLTASDRFVYVLAIPLVLILLVYIVFPMIATVFTSAEDGGAAYADFVSGNSRQALVLSVGISLASVLTAGVVGTGLAVLLTRFSFPGRSVLKVFALLPLALPPLIGALSFYYLYGTSGIIPRVLAEVTGVPASSLSFDGIAGVMLVHTLTMYPYFYLSVSAGLSGSDASLEEAAMNLGASRSTMWRTVLLPMLTPALVSGALLTFMVSMASFTAPQFYNVNTLTMRIVAAKTSGAYDLAAAQSTVLSVVSILFLLLMRWYQNRRLTRSMSKGTPQTVKTVQGILPQILAAIGSAVIVLVLAAPVAAIVLLAFTVNGTWTTQIIPPEYTLQNFIDIFTEPRSLRPLLVSSQMSAVAMAASIVVGVLTAWVIARWKGKGAGVLDLMIMLPWALPGTVVGINIVTAFASPTPFNLGQVFLGSLWILPLAYFIRFVPLVFRNAAASLAQIDPSVEEAAQNLGAGPLRTLRTITLPLMARGVIAGALLAFVQGFGEYVASVVIYPARFVPLSVEIYNRQYANDLGTAFAYGSLQVLAILIVLIISEVLEKPGRFTRRRRRTGDIAETAAATAA
ncbi:MULTISPECIES: ABC transporter permease [Brachybacterium]|uniref:Iron ABC transporter permease n=2 Tax=Brachybacterium TaxID=43668 RepID=A0A426SG87_9MICO|nr:MULTISPECIES: iron ABC transporter permease [Brachybacterium]RRR17064.1 iron ABC transporter permease [Brachybacterium paraconglomeratum]GLI32500.1 iron ABC transporter permease [Brachybacterium conglomeratum]GLK06386.1 iron ABC transporter permease [Brachybacterium conglomeratum]